MSNPLLVEGILEDVAVSRWILTAIAAAVLVACGSSDEPVALSATISTQPTETPRSAATPTPTDVPLTPSPTATPVPQPDIWASRLAIPSLGIDAVVQESEVVPVTNTGGGGGGSGSRTPLQCTSPPETGSFFQVTATVEAEATPESGGATTFSVPSSGIATPRDAFDHLRNRSWIFGHSRWQGVPGLFFVLPGIEVGDELFLDGVDRLTGEPIENQRFVVTGIYLSDTADGAALVSGEDIGASGAALVILQTSVRERGENRPWILDRDTVLAKAENVVRGDIDDPCKYLLLFVVAELEE